MCLYIECLWVHNIDCCHAGEQPTCLMLLRTGKLPATGVTCFLLCDFELTVSSCAICCCIMGLLILTMLCCPVLCPNILSRMPCHAMPCYAMLCYAMLRYAVLCCAVLCHAMPCFAMPCCPHDNYCLVYLSICQGVDQTTAALRVSLPTFWVLCSKESLQVAHGKHPVCLTEHA